MASYKPPVNYRSAASRTPTPEPISVVSGVALLAEAPADPGDASTPMVVLVGGQARTRVTSTPSAGEYMVRTASSPQGVALLPVLDFHASDEGLNGTCDYYRTGTVYTSEWFSFLLSFVTPLTGIASKAALDAAYPATSDATQHGRPGRIAFLADQTGWFSDGAAWRQLSGNPITVTAVDALYAASFGVTSDAIASHVAAMTAALTAGASQDAAWAPPGILAGDLLAAVTLAAALDAAWVPGGLAGAFTAAATLSDARDAVWAAGGGSHTTPVIAAVGAMGWSGSDTSANVTPAVPSSSAGDLLLAVFIAGASASSWPATITGGWSRINAGSSRVGLYSKVASGSAETAPALTTGATGARGVHATVLRITGAATTQPDVYGEATNAATLSGVTTVTDHTLLLAVMSFVDTGTDDGGGGSFDSGAVFGAATGPAATLVVKATHSYASGANANINGAGIWAGDRVATGATGAESFAVTNAGDMGTGYGVALIAVKPA